MLAVVVAVKKFFRAAMLITFSYGMRCYLPLGTGCYVTYLELRDDVTYLKLRDAMLLTFSYEMTLLTFSYGMRCY